LSQPGPEHFRYDDDPDLPGWKRWQILDEGRFNSFIGALSVKAENDRVARVRHRFAREHSNLRDHIHGGALAGFIDMALFAAARGLGILAGPASTVDLSIQFIAGGAIGVETEAEVELLRETGRMLFLRGVVRQGDVTVASFLGTIRKSSPPAGTTKGAG
jgi:acyl-coenzyme A thioesterase PaaI-like protein